MAANLTYIDPIVKASTGRHTATVIFLHGQWCSLLLVGTACDTAEHTCAMQAWETRGMAGQTSPASLVRAQPA